MTQNKQNLYYIQSNLKKLKVLYLLHNLAYHCWFDLTLQDVIESAFQSAMVLIKCYNVANYSSLCSHFFRQGAVNKIRMKGREIKQIWLRTCQIQRNHESFTTPCVTTFTYNCDLTQKTPLCHRVGTFCVTLLTSRSFLRRAQSFNCAHNGVKEQLLTCQLQDCEPRCLLKKAQVAAKVPVWMWAPCHRWVPLVQVHISPRSARRTLVGLCQYSRCFLHPELCFSSTVQVSDYVTDCRFQAATNSSFNICLFTLRTLKLKDITLPIHISI